MREFLYSPPAPASRSVERVVGLRHARVNPVWQMLSTDSARGGEARQMEREAESVGHDIAEDPRYQAAHAADPLGHHDTALSPAVARFFDERLGVDASEVTLRARGEDEALARALSADAFTAGSHVAFGAGRFSPDTSKGRELLAHEMVHVAQQAHGRAPAGAAIQRRPSELIDGFSFLGNTVEGGLNATLRDRLVAVEAHLQKIFDALGPDHPDRVHFGGGKKSLRDWSGITSVRSWRPDSKGLNATSKHASGSAVDINYGLQPYIVTRSTVGGKTVYGGEAAGAHLQAERKAATDVYDRAVAFVHGSGRAADVSSRASGESTASAYRRFSTVDRALMSYLRHAFLQEPTSVKRKPVPNVETASEEDLLKAIPTTERRPETEAIADLEALMGKTFSAGQQFQKSHPGWPYSPREQYFRMLRDYELVRVPMQRGNPSASPSDTRNPTRGFLHMRQEFVEAMADVGKLRWGAVDLGGHTSGDVHHFDLGHHGGVTPDGTP